jgi:hypothetical protein
MLTDRYLQHEETLITEEDRKAYPSGARATGEEAMSSFKHLLEHAIDIQVSTVTLIAVNIEILTADRYSLIIGSYTLRILKWVDCIRRWETTIRREPNSNWSCQVSLGSVRLQAMLALTFHTR